MFVWDHLLGTSSGKREEERIILPVGDGVMITSRAWMNVIPNGPSDANVKITYYNKNGAVLRTDNRDLKATTPPQLYNAEFPNGTVQVLIDYSMPDGGKYLIEALAR